VAERGGPATQAGIQYQNSVSALYLGRMCDAASRPDRGRVVEVRVEAPTEVDDTILRFADGHRMYIQAKLDVRRGDKAWRKLWKDFDAQFRREGFERGRDRLLLCVGTFRPEHHELQQLCLRATTSEDYEELWDRLTSPQRALVREIDSIRSGSVGEADALEFLSHIDVEIWTPQHIEDTLLPDWMPDSDASPTVVFGLLRDQVASEAARRGRFTSNSVRHFLEESGISLTAPPDADSLRASVRMCGAVLRQHKSNLGNTGPHIRRGVVEEIVAWAREASDEKNAAVLLDSAGMGKTVVMRDALDALEVADFTVLAIKADQQLSGVATEEDLREALGLPDRVEAVVGRLAALGPVAVLVDQVDALSLSLARDQKTLNIVLGTVAKLRLIPNVRVLFSCRTFDLNNDPRLRRVEVAQRFALPQLADEEVAGVLRAEDIDLGTLSPATRELLRVPLHLDLFLRILEERSTSDVGRGIDGISTLQHLYALLWQEVILAPDPESPPAHEREQVLRLMTDYMDRERRTLAPQSIFARPDTQHLDGATRWLASAGILVRSGTGWSFLHQTFFDYCYARQFVDSGGSLSEVILTGYQGLFARPQLVQVLAYLRGSGSSGFLPEVNLLFHAEGLRFHLKELLFGWFGGLADPTDDEWLLARRLLADPATRPRFLKAIGANPGWFARLRGRPIEDLLAQDDEVLDAEVVPYLVSMVDIEQEGVVSLLRPFLGRSDRWNARVGWVLGRIRDWHTLAAVELFEQLLREVPASEVGNTRELDEVVKAFPREGCRLIRLVLDRSLDTYLESGGWRRYRGLLRDMPLHDYTLQEAFKAASAAAPGDFVEAVLPWLQRVVGLTDPPDYEPPYFAPDVLSHGWYDGLDPAQNILIRAVIDALTALAQTQRDRFRAVAGRLAAMPYQTPQQLLAHVHRAVPEAYAEDALRFLLGDRRRLNLGDNQQYDSRRLISAIYPFLTEAQRTELEAYIVSWNLVLPYRGVEGLKCRGLEQLYLLQAIPPDYLTARGARCLAELERKFPGVRAREAPLITEARAVGSPIDEDAHAKMSDEAWLRAMKKYHGSVRHRDWHRGGAYQLAASLQRRVKEEPERFYDLAMRAPEDVDDEYAGAFITGLAEAEAPAEWLFEVVDRFARDPARDIKRTVAWALEKRCDEGLSRGMMKWLESVVRGPMGDDERRVEQNGDGPSGVYLNSDRGASMRTLMQALDAQGDDGDRERMWALIEHAAGDPSTALRAGAIEELLYRLLTEDRDRAMALFETLMDGHPALLCDHDATSFVYYGSYRHFSRMEPFVRALMNHEDEKCAQRGAELACVAAISSADALGSDEDLSTARALAESAVTGPPALRRGAAKIYARNMDSRQSDACARELIRLLDDEDDDVRRSVGGAFSHARGVWDPGTRRFVEEFAASHALAEEEDDFAEYLWEYGPDDPLWALSVLEAALDNRHPAGPIRRGGEQFVRLVLRIYTDPTADAAIKSRAMDAFDRLMERYAYEARRALEEWDRR
jgi:hypothetical protein